MFPNKTRAAMLSAPRASITVGVRDLPRIEPHQVVVRMEACGICHSDLYVASLEKLPLLPVTLGHEGIGRVVEVGHEVSGFAVGDRVGITFMGTTCGVCDLCTSGRRRFCAKQTNFGYSLDGALSEYAVVPASSLVRVPQELAAADAAPLCCAGWTAWGALREASLEQGQKLALFGFGGLGHLAIQMARHRGLHVAAVDLSAEKLEMARNLGAEFTAVAETAGRTIQKEYGGVDAAIVLTPSTAAIQQAFRSLKRNGTLVLVGITVTDYQLPLVDTIVTGIQSRGSDLGTQEELAEVFELARTGAIRPHVQTHSLDEVPAVLDRLHRGEILGRAVIAF
jgi:propanol-preferring alcohol dehydrogenase